MTRTNSEWPWRFFFLLAAGLLMLCLHINELSGRVLAAAVPEPTACAEPAALLGPFEPESEVSEADVQHLAIAIYREAGGDSVCDACRHRVGDVVLNRVADPRYPDTIEAVLTQPGQYGTLCREGIVWPERASLPQERHAVVRAEKTARTLLSGDHSELYAEGYVFQSEFPDLGAGQHPMLRHLLRERMKQMNWNYSCGDLVRVTHVPTKYCTDRDRVAVGLIGEVHSCYADTVSVKFPGLANPRSESGLYYFGHCHIEPFMTAGEAALNPELMLEHLNKKEEIPMLKNFIPAGIKFESGANTDRVYAYALYDYDIVVGDLVVVNTGHHGMAVARVATIGEIKKEEVACGREIICKVDTTAFKDRKAKAQRMAELKKEMDAMVQDLQATALYELMAEKNPALATLLSEFKSLGA